MPGCARPNRGAGRGQRRNGSGSEALPSNIAGCSYARLALACGLDMRQTINAGGRDS
ncbi:hypothetical protein FRC09_011297, partial [Ceratobasidium sp. 395]